MAPPERQPGRRRLGQHLRADRARRRQRPGSRAGRRPRPPAPHLAPAPQSRRDLLRRGSSGFIVPEMNQGQLVTLLRSEYLVPGRRACPRSPASHSRSPSWTPPSTRPWSPETMNAPVLPAAPTQGLRHRPGGALVPRLRRLCDPEGGAQGPGRPPGRPRPDRVRLRHRLCRALTLLCRDLRLPYHPRSRAGRCDRRQARQSGARCLDRRR